MVTLPDQGESAIYNFVNSATTSIDITIYELRDTTLVNDLVAKEKAGVKVRVIFDAQHSSIDGPAYTALQNAGAGVTYSSSAFTYTHQKTITVDDRESYISTGNFDTTYYATSRDFGVFDTNQADVSAIESVFNADYAKHSITPSDGADLVWSPTDSQSQLLALINSAKTSLDIEQEEFEDPTLVNAVVAAAQRGVAVRVVAENEDNANTTELNEVTAAGGQVKTYTSSTGYYIHAKAIVVDDGTANQRVFLGSENFSNNSLNDNRELGLIVSDTGVINGVEQAFDNDFGGSSGGGGGGGTSCSGQLLGNGGFESGTASPWTVSSSKILYDGSREPAHTGSWDAWLDGYGRTHTDTLAQTVTLPSGCSASLTFWLHIDTAETTTTAKNDTLKVQLLDSSGNVLRNLYTYSNLNANTGYGQHTFDLSAYAGQPVTLKFTGSENSSKQTSFVIDDAAITVS
ncbi:hypothetical protein EFY87_18750 [Flexivirga caeni]|uniref:phospholipase D n=1 Tax=Flexivirga caeni TaxID=2294115 RepID=A0A3M9LYG3_9MICO|nr:hypothetical protein EFY87_18750 [Flexivirga caeni]